MKGPENDRTGLELVVRAEASIAALDKLEAVSREAAFEAVRALVQLYGEALTRISRGLPDEIAAPLARDDLVSHLLLVHGLHPSPLAERIERALDEVRPYLRSHGGDVDLVSAAEGVVRLRLRGSCDGCPASTTTMRTAIEDAIQRLAPDVERIEADAVSGASGGPFQSCPTDRPAEVTVR